MTKVSGASLSHRPLLTDGADNDAHHHAFSIDQPHQTHECLLSPGQAKDPLIDRPRPSAPTVDVIVNYDGQWWRGDEFVGWQQLWRTYALCLT